MRKHVPILASLRPKTVARFHAKLVLEPGGCLAFTGTRNKRGYGFVDTMTNGARTPLLAHRLAWALEHGMDPPADLIICHRCNNPACCLPAHLYAGTPQDNVDDMVRAGRGKLLPKGAGPWVGKTGSAHPRHKDYTR